jgi:hypothetical protein
MKTVHKKNQHGIIVALGFSLLMLFIVIRVLGSFLGYMIARGY